MTICFYKQRIEELRAEMVVVFNTSNNFTDQAVLKVSQELDYFLNKYSLYLAGKLK